MTTKKKGYPPMRIRLPDNNYGLKSVHIPTMLELLGREAFICEQKIIALNKRFIEVKGLIKYFRNKAKRGAHNPVIKKALKKHQMTFSVKNKTTGKTWRLSDHV